MLMHPTNMNIQSQCIWSLVYVAEVGDENRNRLAKRKVQVISRGKKATAFDVIVSAMAQFPETDRIQLGGCMAIEAVSGERGGGRGE